jgi:sphingolipid delta-4 desaturase
MILDKHPEIAKLLTCDKPYTIFIALFVIIASLVNCYYAKDFPLWLLLLDAYLIGGLLNHTLHCCIHDFTHFAGHTNANINRFMAILCNIPMGIPSALSFGRYHSDHHNFLN